MVLKRNASFPILSLHFFQLLELAQNTFLLFLFFLLFLLFSFEKSAITTIVDFVDFCMWSDVCTWGESFAFTVFSSHSHGNTLGTWGMLNEIKNGNES